MSNNVRQVNQDYNPSRVIKEVFGIEISENKYARRLQVFLTFAFVPPLINVTFMIMVTILYLPISYQTCFVSLICPFVPLIAYYSFVYASPRLLLLYGLSAWIMIGLRAFALAQVFNHLSLVKALILSCTVNDDGTVIEAVEHSEFECSLVKYSDWEVADSQAHNSGVTIVIYLTCFIMEIITYLVLICLSVMFFSLLKKGKVIRKFEITDEVITERGGEFDRPLRRGYDISNITPSITSQDSSINYR